MQMSFYTFVSNQGRGKPSNKIMKQIVLEELNKIAKEILPKRDHERWDKVMEKLQANEDPAMITWKCLKTIMSYDGDDYNRKPNENLPKFNRGWVVVLKFGELTIDIPAFVHTVHEYNNKYKYDLNIVIPMPDGMHPTRLYNIDECWLKKLE